MATQTFRIGELAKKAGVSPDTLRYYERLGLLSGIARTMSGYRQYPPSALEQIQLIRNAMQFGFSLKQVRQFLRSRESGRPPCQQVRMAGEEILRHVERQIKELQAASISIRKTLADWDCRLHRASAGQPARLLDSLNPDHHSNCASLRKRYGP